MIDRKVLADHIRAKRPDLDPDEVLSSPIHMLRWEVDYRRTKIQNERSSMQTNVRALITAINTAGGLTKLAKQDMPLRLAYRFGRLLDSARSAAKSAQKERDRLFDEIGVPILDPVTKEPTSDKKIPEGLEATFTQTMDDYLDGTMVDIWFEPVKLSELDAASIRLSPNDLIALGPFLDTEDGAEK